MPRAWWEGNVEVSDSREGDDGVAYGVIEDGTTFTTEVPNVLCGLPKMTTQDGPPHEYWTSKDESCGAWLAKVAIKRCCKKVASTLALSVINRFRYMLHQMTNVWGWMGLPHCSEVFLFWVLNNVVCGQPCLSRRCSGNINEASLFFAPLHFSSRLPLLAKSSLPLNPPSKISHGVYTFSDPKILATSLASS